MHLMGDVFLREDGSGGSELVTVRPVSGEDTATGEVCTVAPSREHPNLVEFERVTGSRSRPASPAYRVGWDMVFSKGSTASN